MYGCGIYEQHKRTLAPERGIYYDPITLNQTPILNNTIVYFNSPGDLILDGSGPDAQSTFYYNCDIGGFANLPNKNNKDLNPKFVDNSNNDYRISLNDGSPCIGAGDNAYSSISEDLKGDNRIISTTIDMGAYEYEYPPGPGYKIIATNSENTGKVQIYPNPVQNMYYICVESENEQFINVAVINALGEVVSNKEFSIEKGSNKLIFNRDGLTAGIYFARIIYGNGEEKQCRIIVN